MEKNTVFIFENGFVSEELKKKTNKIFLKMQENRPFGTKI